MILHNKLVIVIIALFAQKSLAQYPKVRCPDTFQYERDDSGREVIARLYVRLDDFGENKIKITLSQPDHEENDAYYFKGNITLDTDEEDLYDFIKEGRIVTYIVLFPVAFVIPTLHSIRVNGKRICTGPKVPPGNKIFVLRHTIDVPEENTPRTPELPARHAAPVYLSAVNDDDDPDAYFPIQPKETAYGVRRGPVEKSAYGDRPRPTLKSAYGTRPTTSRYPVYNEGNVDEDLEDNAYGPRPTEKSAYAVGPRPAEKSAYGDRPRPTLKSAYGTRPTTSRYPVYNEGNEDEDLEDNAYGPRPTEKSAYAVGPRPAEKSAYGDRPRPTLKSAYGTRPTTIADTSTTTTAKPPPSQSDLQQNTLGWPELGRICGRENLNITVDRLAIHGKTISKARFPWIVAIYKNSAGKLQFQCGGSLITQRTVISAAHCFYSGYDKIKVEDVLVSLGRHKLTDWTASYITQSDVVKIVFHPDYDPTFVYNDADIAIVQLEKSVTFTNSIQPACIWQGDTEQSEIENVSGTVVGWGRDENNKDVSTFPKLITANIVSKLTCITHSPEMLYLTSNRTLCAGNLDGTGPCTGDSGSGLMIKVGNKWRLRGLVSLALSDENSGCNLKNYVVYSDIAQFSGWVFDNCAF